MAEVIQSTRRSENDFSAVEAAQRARLVVAFSEVAGLIPVLYEAGVSTQRFNEATAALTGAGLLRHAEALPDPPSSNDFDRATRHALIAIEDSPMPRIEWPSMSGLLDHLLPDLVGVSASSVARYRSGDRDTPDPVALRLHTVALIVRDLAGSYNDFGIRRWFQRPRSALGGKSPASALSGEWDPDDQGPRAVRDLAARLIDPGVG